MTKLLFKLLVALALVTPAFAQRTPLKVNGNVVSNPNLTNSAEIGFSVSGGDITASVTNELTLTTLTVTTTLNAPSTFNGGTIYVTNLYVTNLTSVTTTNLNNTFISNLFVTEVTVTNNINIKGNTTTSNLFTFNLTVTNTINALENSYFSNLFALYATVTNQFVAYNNTYLSNVYFTNLFGTIDPTQTDLTVKQRRSLKLQYPRKIDGAGCTYSSTNDYTAALFMIPRFSATGATNANYAEFAFRVPSDLDTSVDLTASLSVQLAGADTSAATYTVGMVSIANSSAGAGTPANYVTLTVAADASGASGDIESVNGTTLTGWRSNMTANQWCLVRLQRDGSDASAVAQDGLELEIFYTSTQ
jgi:hypothetical protein